jgi:hypothetical protein
MGAGAAAAGCGTVAAIGTSTGAPHLGQDARLPAKLSGADNFFPQLMQVTAIFMIGL